MLVNAGLLTPDERLELFIRQSTGLPSRDPNVHDPQPDPAPAAPVAPPPAARIPIGRRRTNPEGAMTLWDEQ